MTRPALLVTVAVAVAALLAAPATARDEQRHSWQEARVVDGGRAVKVLYITSPILPLRRAVVRSGRSSVRITLWRARPPEGAILPSSAEYRCVRIPLRSRLGARKLVDGRTGRVRPRSSRYLRGRRCDRTRVRYR